MNKKNLFFFFFLILISDNLTSNFNQELKNNPEATFKSLSLMGFISILTMFSYDFLKFIYNKYTNKIDSYNLSYNIEEKIKNLKYHTIKNNHNKKNNELENEEASITLKKNNEEKENIAFHLSKHRLLKSSKVNSEIKWENVFLPNNIKDDLLNYVKNVFSLKNSTHNISSPNILCLYGLPGTDKTTIIKGISNELNIPLIIVDPFLLDENIYNKVTLENIINHAKKNNGPCIVHIKNIEKMSKIFLVSCFKTFKTGINDKNILLSFSCNNDVLINDLGFHKNNNIKFYIIDKPKSPERYQLIKYILSLYELLIDITNININYITNLLNSCKQKDILLIIERAIENKKIKYLQTNPTDDDIEFSNEIKLTNSDIIESFKLYQKQETIILGQNESTYNTGLTDSDAFIIENPKITFDNIIGLDHIKKELQFLANYLKNPDEYKKINFRIPKGILFKGPPGCGKTLMARAIAGEAGITVITINGSDFIDKYVGAGARKIREVFAIAKIHGPTIIYIDEIDAIGTKRSDGSEDGGGKEYAHTLTALLSEMDGFDNESTKNNIIVIASTNRNLEALDAALMRRFEEKYNFSLPVYKDRIKILKLYLKDTLIVDDFSFESLASKTIGFSGADLEHLVNQSKYIAITRIKSSGEDLNNFKIISNDIIHAYNNMSIGYEILNANIDPEELYKTAIHESGHTLCMLMQENYPREFDLVTITPRDKKDGIVLGFARNFDKYELNAFSKEELEKLIIVSLGGMIAEDIIFNTTSSGVSSDLEHASHLAKLMITKFGMSDELLYSSSDNKLTEKELTLIENILQKCKNKCRELLQNNQDLLKILAENLLLNKTLNKNQIIRLILANRPGLKLN